MFCVYSSWFSVFLDRFFPFLSLLNVTSSIQILFLIMLSTAAATYKIQTIAYLEQMKAFCQGLTQCADNKYSLILAILTE